jgi:hypothetical protein
MTPALLLAELGQRIVDDGPATHHLLLQHLATLVAAAAPGTAAALADPTAPDVVRHRALADAGTETSPGLSLAA